eukprot:6492196-Amphidinium_carterae.2
MDASQKFLVPGEVPQTAPSDASGAAASTDDPAAAAKLAKQELRLQQQLTSKRAQAQKKKEGFMRVIQQCRLMLLKQRTEGTDGDVVKDHTKKLVQAEELVCRAKLSDATKEELGDWMEVFDQQLDALRETWGLKAQAKAKAKPAAKAASEPAKPDGESDSDLYPDDEVAKEAKVDEQALELNEDGAQEPNEVGAKEQETKEDEANEQETNANVDEGKVAEPEDPAEAETLVAEPKPSTKKRWGASLRSAAEKNPKES